MASTETALLDEVLPSFDISAKYSIRVRATPDRIYRVLQEGVPTGLLTKLLMLLRGIPRFLSGAKKRRRVRSEDAFYKLKQSQNREIVIGIIGQFWKPVSNPLPIHNLDEFLEFQKEGYCKAALNLRISPYNARECVVSTETRILGYGSAKEPFANYWRVIAPFSGLIRKEILRKIKSKAES